ncbi:Uncharacterized protein At5g39865 [Linum perenne]
MKGMKGKLLKKLNSIKPVVSLKQPGLVLQPLSVHQFESVSENHPVKPTIKKSSEVSLFKPYIENDGTDLDDWDGDFVDDKENFGRPPVKALFPSCDSEEAYSEGANRCEQRVLKNLDSAAEIDISSFRRPDFDSATLFDPNLLAAFEKALKDYMRWIVDERRARNRSTGDGFQLRRSRGEECLTEQDSNLKQSIDKEEPPLESSNETGDPLLRFEDKCPPGGTDAVILYTTTLRGIRKTFEDCSGVRFLLQSLRIRYHERDVSMHRVYREELWEVLGGKIMPPRLFVKGKYIGGAEEVLGLNEQGKFRPIFAGIPVDDSSVEPCEACNGVGFVLCFNCSGSHRILTEDDGSWRECLDCNENGLIICRHCCCC